MASVQQPPARHTNVCVIGPNLLDFLISDPTDVTATRKMKLTSVIE